MRVLPTELYGRRGKGSIEYPAQGRVFLVTRDTRPSRRKYISSDCVRTDASSLHRYIHRRSTHAVMSAPVLHPTVVHRYKRCGHILGDGDCAQFYCWLLQAQCITYDVFVIVLKIEGVVIKTVKHTTVAADKP